MGRNKVIIAGTATCHVSGSSHSLSEPFRAVTAMQLPSLSRNGFDGEWEGALTWCIAAPAIFTCPSVAMLLVVALLRAQGHNTYRTGPSSYSQHTWKTQENMQQTYSSSCSGSSLYPGCPHLYLLNSQLNNA